MKYSQLKNHIKGYQNHWMRKLTCPEMKDEEFFQRSLNPYHVVLGRDVVVRGGSEEQTMEEEVRMIVAEEQEEEKENRKPAEQRGVEEEKENKGCSEETVEEVAEESGEKGQDLFEQAITLCDINEEVEFSPDYEEGGGRGGGDCYKGERGRDCFGKEGGREVCTDGDGVGRRGEEEKNGE